MKPGYFGEYRQAIRSHLVNDHMVAEDKLGNPEKAHDEQHSEGAHPIEVGEE